MVAAHGAVGATLEPKLAEGQVECIVGQQPADKRRANANDQLDGLGRLQRAEHTGQHAEHACGRAVGYLSRRLWKQAAITRAFSRHVGHRLAFKAMDRGGHQRLG